MDEKKNASCDCDVLVIGAGISGLATAKCCLQAGLETIVLEKTGDVGGLWTYRKYGYGVMKCTHINVSKHNYAFSDHPFPDSTQDFPSHRELAAYIKSYCVKFNLTEHIYLHHQVKSLMRKEDKSWEATVAILQETEQPGQYIEKRTVTFTSRFVAAATGHHVKPKKACFVGEETFPGTIIHSADYKDVAENNLCEKRVVVIGIGNSAVDVAIDLATRGRSNPVYISSRSGAWVIPNYVLGEPVDLYACRLLLNLPWRWLNAILEFIVAAVSGHPDKWGLNPKMKALQTQPTVSATLIHHIQRKQIRIMPNIERIQGNMVTFTDGRRADVDAIIMCTGYAIDLSYLAEGTRRPLLAESENDLSLYKNVFAPTLGSSLAFIGFIQPASGGILACSEMQARWFAELCRGHVVLPSVEEMIESIKVDKEAIRKRYFASPRHTMQKDPLIYCDEIASFIGAKPELKKHPYLAFNLIFGSGGTSQYRLQGPYAWEHAEREVTKVPIPGFLKLTAWLLLFGAALSLFISLYIIRDILD